MMDIRDATAAWVRQFDALPRGVVEKLMLHKEGEVVEVTPPSKHDRVRVFGGGYDGEGEIIGITADKSVPYRVALDSGERVWLEADDFEVIYDDALPMWGMMWAFESGLDDRWVREKGGLQIMADCGFRIYTQDDYEYIFGIDGAGYDFYEAHWIPLYKARGLHWHYDEKGESNG